MNMSSVPMDGLNAAVAAVLRGERAMAGMTIDELSQRSGIPKVSVQRFLAGRRPINLDVLEALCSGLRLIPEDVVSQARERQHRADPELVDRVVQGIRASSGTPVTSVPESS